MAADSYTTHLPVLRLAAAITTGPIIELGCGDGSTPFLCSLARPVLSADTDDAWLRKFVASCPRPWKDAHRFEFVNDWRDFSLIEERFDWGFALVDCAPGEDRPDLANRLAFRCEFVICHDAGEDGSSNYRWNRCIGNFKYVSYYKAETPWTMILSNRRPFPIEDVKP